jgi:alpha-mannosidase
MRPKFFYPLFILMFISSLSDASIPEAVFQLSDEGAIGSWLHVGPIHDATDAGSLLGHNTDYLSGEGSATPIRNKKEIIQDKEFLWNLLFEEKTTIRLSDRYPGLDRICSYFYCILESDKDIELSLHIKRDDAAKVWLGGKLVYDKQDEAGDKPEVVPVSVMQGPQPLLVKVCQKKGKRGFSVQFKDADGNLPQGISIILPGEFDESEYFNHLFKITSPPLVNKDGKRELQLRIPAYVNPNTIDLIEVFDDPQSTEPAWSLETPSTRRIKVAVDRANKPRDVIFRAFTSSEREYKNTFNLKPCRDWRVYLMAGSHVDIGYTNHQDVVMADHKKFYRQAWDLYEESVSKKYDKDAYYIWNPEVNWVLKDFLRTEPEEDCKRLLDYLRSGVFSLDALYGNILTALCGDEELIRNVYFSKHLAQRENLPEVVSAMITDVPGYTWGMVPVLAGSGVKYFNIGPNHTARIGFATLSLKYHPYYWIGPDGVSKVLVWNTGYGYSNNFNMLRSEDGVDQFLQVLADYEADEAYPYDVAQFRAYLVDNTPPPDHLSHMVQEWNQQYQVPRLILSGAAAPSQYLESKYKDQIPSYKGDYTPYWEDGAGSSARESAMNRTATLRMQESEKAWALAYALDGKQPVPSKKIEQGYDYAMLYSEHTWGAHNSVSEPESEFAMKQWETKRSFAHNALWYSSELKRGGIQTLSGNIKNDQPLRFAVWNLTQWKRSGAAVIPFSEALGELISSDQWTAVDASGNECSVVRNDDGYVFQVKDIPPFGYSTYQFIPKKKEITVDPIDINVSDGVMFGENWELKLDKKTGGVSSLVYLPENLELVDADSPYGLNQYLHVLGPNGKDSKSAQQVILTSKRDPLGMSGSLIAHVEGQGIDSLQQEIKLYPQQNRIDFINTMLKSDIRDKEAVRFAFPFKVPEGEFTLEIPLASMHPETEQIPGANRNIYTVRRWIDASNKDYGVTLVTHDAPLIELCDMHAEQPWLEHLPLVNTHLFSFAMNNYWFTNYLASQGGPAVFRYSLVFHKDQWAPNQANEFADHVTSPFCVEPLRINPDAALADKTMSLASIDKDHVLIQNIKKAENADGIIIRVRELNGQSTNANLSFPLWQKFKWSKCDLVERPVQDANGTSDNGTLPFAIGGGEIATYLIEPMD